MYVLAGMVLFLASCGEVRKDTDKGVSDAATKEVQGEAARQPDAEAPSQAQMQSAAEPSLEQAQAIAMEAQKALGSTLKKKIAESGPIGAIGFCSAKALPITDSVATLHGVRVQRVTDRPRNPVNRATEMETSILADWAESLQGDAFLQPVNINEGGLTHYYFPIQTNALCMNCHGRPEKDIDPGVFTLLKETYPQDQALGYSPNQLRGMWKITFKPSSETPTP